MGELVNRRARIVVTPIKSRPHSGLTSGLRSIRYRPAAARPAAPAIRADDAPLVAELARDGRAGVVALARATGWPQSRVSARLAELLASGAMHVTTDLADFEMS